ncbi:MULTISPECIES: polysaccharide deacetylase family protein [Rhodomicrobium]|uniref:polysaccharide deacetylase family protein n=1 Tax=Rhodomicrobium TaxID=1068 RepID=UPI000B4B52B4|nr:MULTISPECIES: polysaccharide deacetylase family protein [Rhodomicrobium]
MTQPVDFAARRYPVGALLFALAVFGPAGANAAGGEAAQCWSDAALHHRAGDERIQHNVAAAVIAPPKGQITPRPAAGDAGLGAVRRVELPPGSKKIAITFDLCEQPHEIAGYQGALVDLLREQNVKATFFAGGKWMLSHSERAQQLMSDPLFELGNHSWEHRNLRVTPADVMANEITAPQLAYRAVRADLAAKRCTRPGDDVLADKRAPKEIKLFRFPYGACNPASLNAVAERGLTAIQWDVSAGDPWPKMMAPMMVKAVVAGVRPGSIVIFHANGRGWHTQEALPEIIAKLKAKGFEFVTVSELLAAGKPVVDARCYNAKPGDTDRYDMVGLNLGKRGGKRPATADPFGLDPDAAPANPQTGWKARAEPY